MPLPPVTDRQLSVLAFVANYRRTRGVAPTLAEIGEAHGVGKAAAFYHVEALVGKGILGRKPGGGSRTLVVLKPELLAKRPRLRLAVLGTVNSKSGRVQFAT